MHACWKSPHRCVKKKKDKKDFLFAIVLRLVFIFPESNFDAQFFKRDIGVGSLERSPYPLPFDLGQSSSVLSCECLLWRNKTMQVVDCERCESYENADSVHFHPSILFHALPLRTSTSTILLW